MLYLRPRLPSRVKIDVVTPEDTERTVPLNRSLFSWVLENLVRNAIDAMEGEGSLTIEIVPEGPEVHIDITDTGKGIPTAQFRTVFQPGFTTKKARLGSRPLAEQTHHRAIPRRADLREAQRAGQRDNVPDHA